MPVARTLLFACLLAVASAPLAATERDVDALLARDAPPAGVLFEIVTGDPTALDALLPTVAAEATRLRDRFPGLEIVVLTHGSEQFALLEEERSAQPVVHGKVQSLVADGIAVEVCGNHASWRGKWADDFPDYVVVADSASAQVARYRERGFAVIRPRR